MKPSCDTMVINKVRKNLGGGVHEKEIANRGQ